MEAAREIAEHGTFRHLGEATSFADVNGWLLSELVPVATGRGRGLSLGTIRSADGTLLATVAQEVLLRRR